jgi:2-oxoisovalerate dehydrogenase E1 component alpha subunit
VQQTDLDLQWTRFDARRATLGLTHDDIIRLYIHMLRARLLDERLTNLRLRGQISGGASCRGHEAVQVGILEPFHIGLDYLLPYYRDLAAVFMVGLTPDAILLNHFGRSDDPISGARMRPAQWNSRELRIISASGLVATQTLHATGIAFAARLRHENAVALTMFGDGATSEGDFHEALNFAGLHHLGVIFVCENNGIALSTPFIAQSAAPHVADRAAGYGMPGVIVDGADIFAIIEAARSAFERARGGQGPTLIEMIIPHLADRTPRGDAFIGRDPVALLRDYLLAKGELTIERGRQLHKQFEAELDEAEKAALAAMPPDAATVEQHLYATTEEESSQPDNKGEEE